MRETLPAKKSLPGHSRGRQEQIGAAGRRAPLPLYGSTPLPARQVPQTSMPVALPATGGLRPGGLPGLRAIGQCACGAQGSSAGECAACRAQRLAGSGQQQRVPSAPRLAIRAQGPMAPERTSPGDEAAVRHVLVVGQSTPDGTTLGPTDPAHRTCLASNRLIWTGGAGQNTATAATGRSRVTAHLGSAPGDGTDCSCGCGLFRQYIRGFWRLGSPTAPKQHDIGSCGHTITISENAWTEEFEACNPGGPPLSAACDRVYLDAPGFSAGLADGTFAQVHFDLRYQMWDQCRGRAIATGDRSLRIRGDRSPRSITFS
ncbi:MAG: hypothetical protein AB7N91_21330 [Candidatus Tectimicrobiota bacterium]